MCGICIGEVGNKNRIYKIRKMLKQVSDFKASINNCKDCMTEEAKAILLSDFLETNNLYLK